MAKGNNKSKKKKARNREKRNTNQHQQQPVNSNNSKEVDVSVKKEAEGIVQTDSPKESSSKPNADGELNKKLSLAADLRTAVTITNRIIYEQNFRSLKKEKPNDYENYIERKREKYEWINGILSVIGPIVITSIPFYVKGNEAGNFWIKYIDKIVLLIALVIFVVLYLAYSHKHHKWDGISAVFQEDRQKLVEDERDRANRTAWLYDGLFEKELDLKGVCNKIEVALLSEIAAQPFDNCSIAIYCKEEKKIQMLDFHGPSIEPLVGTPKMRSAGVIKEDDPRYKDYFSVRRLNEKEKSNCGIGGILLKNKGEIKEKLNVDDDAPYNQYCSFFMELNEKNKLLIEIITYNDKLLNEGEIDCSDFIKRMFKAYAPAINLSFNRLVTDFNFGEK